ncbi:MAG: signal recognition particle-docking protein FtsY [Desulfobacterales bacterium]|nr:signal recognition particle-docking protein FtsY [Desulfobacterales bacterium]
MSFFTRLTDRLSETRKILTGGIDRIFLGKRSLDGDLIEQLEELLITADIGVQATQDLIENISNNSSKITDVNQLKKALKAQLLALFHSTPSAVTPMDTRPHVIMVVGVNGVGKTTTIGKLAARFGADGKKVLIAAADTFRAAAVEQLTVWAQRAKADIVKHKENTDPAAVAFDGIEASIARGSDVVIVDTAGRLHTNVNLMGELKKVKRTISKQLPGAPHEVLLILDATTGQNAISQARIFHEALGVTGIALTKLDGTAKGGIAVSICKTLNIPLKYIGTGETIEELQDFDPGQFVDALF